MAQAGVGVDMFAVSRMELMLQRRPRVAEVVFTDAERAFCKKSGQPARCYAECVAARGAVKKALGDSEVSMRDISTVRSFGERPQVVLGGRAMVAAQKQGIREVALSLSCSDGVAVANAVALTDEVRPPHNEKPNPQAELQASFKQARSVLDELERQGKSKKV